MGLFDKLFTLCCCVCAVLPCVLTLHFCSVMFFLR